MTKHEVFVEAQKKLEAAWKLYEAASKEYDLALRDWFKENSGSDLHTWRRA